MENKQYVPLVDTHAHIFRRDLPFIPGAVHTLHRDFTLEDYLAELDGAGVQFAAIAAASFLGTYTDYTLEALRKHSRLRATIIADPSWDLQRLRDLDRAGVVGIRFATGNMKELPDFRTAAYRNLLRNVVELDWHVHVYSRREHLPMILSVLDEAGVKIVVDHFGARDNESGEQSESFRSIIAALRKGRTWVKFSGPYLSERLDHRRLAEIFLHEGGPARMLWGSDWPFVKIDNNLRYRQAVDWLLEWVPGEITRRQIDRNAMSLYRFPRTD